MLAAGSFKLDELRSLVLGDFQDVLGELLPFPCLHFDHILLKMAPCSAEIHTMVFLTSNLVRNQRFPVPVPVVGVHALLVVDLVPIPQGVWWASFHQDPVHAAEQDTPNISNFRRRHCLGILR